MTAQAVLGCSSVLKPFPLLTAQFPTTTQKLHAFDCTLRNPRPLPVKLHLDPGVPLTLSLEGPHVAGHLQIVILPHTAGPHGLLTSV
jgi:hypothetical protein